MPPALTSCPPNVPECVTPSKAILSSPCNDEHPSFRQNLLKIVKYDESKISS
ncbi:MAG TPA: hypothetical protein VI895_00245 [Bdellovibrionota bacterium]|nr:hypothetical protein [Bdellovibrionota bacterium]